MTYFDAAWPFSSGIAGPSNHQTLANVNRRKVLGLIVRKKCLSQKEISNHTKLRASTVSNIIRMLKEIGLVREGSLIRAERAGPKEISLEIAEDYAWSIGVSVDRQSRIVAIDAAGSVLDRADFAPGCSLSQLLDALPGMVSEIQARRRLPWSGLAGVGVSVAGVVDANHGMILLSTVMNERMLPLQSTMDTTLGVPVWVERNVVCGAYAEYIVGATRAVDSFLYFSITRHLDEERGYGVASVVDEKLVRGIHSAAGEVDFLINRLMPAPRSDGDARPVAEHFYENCGEALAIIVNLLDIDCVVLANSDSELTQKRHAAVEKSMRRRLVSVPGRQVNLKKSMLQAGGPLLGSALLVLHQKLARDATASLGRRSSETSEKNLLSLTKAG